jgi:hypothetical protein
MLVDQTDQNSVSPSLVKRTVVVPVYVIAWLFIAVESTGVRIAIRARIEFLQNEKLL